MLHFRRIFTKSKDQCSSLGSPYGRIQCYRTLDEDVAWGLIGDDDAGPLDGVDGLPAVLLGS
eukprot:1497819-Amphidinium_carterae.1